MQRNKGWDLIAKGDPFLIVFWLKLDIDFEVIELLNILLCKGLTLFY